MFFQIAVSLAALGPAECSRRAEFLGSSSEVAVVLASPTGRKRWVSGLESVGLDGAGPDIERVEAFEFVINDVDGGRDNLAMGDTIRIVPWGYRSDCAREVFDVSGWVPPHALGVFFLTDVRVDNGQLVYDVFGEHAPYPHGAFLASLRRPRPPEDRTQWLSALEFFELMKALPHRVDGESPTGWLERLEAAFSALPPDWSERFPGDGLLWEARYAVGRRRGPAF